MVRDYFHDWNVLESQPQSKIDLMLAFADLERQAKEQGAHGK